VILQQIDYFSLLLLDKLRPLRFGRGSVLITAAFVSPIVPNTGLFQGSISSALTFRHRHYRCLLHLIPDGCACFLNSAWCRHRLPFVISNLRALPLFHSLHRVTSFEQHYIGRFTFASELTAGPHYFLPISKQRSTSDHFAESKRICTLALATFISNRFTTSPCGLQASDHHPFAVFVLPSRPLGPRRSHQSRRRHPTVSRR
jgi:hypothetical protein